MAYLAAMTVAYELVAESLPSFVIIFQSLPEKERPRTL